MLCALTGNLSYIQRTANSSKNFSSVLEDHISSTFSPPTHPFPHVLSFYFYLLTYYFDNLLSLVNIAYMLMVLGASTRGMGNLHMVILSEKSNSPFYITY